MGKDIFYAMDRSALQAYIDHKNNISAAVLKMTDDQVEKIKMQVQEQRSGSRELYTVDSEGAAHITIAGVLEPKPDVCAILFDLDMTTYSDIIEGIQKAEADDSVSKIILDVDTPGGNVIGLFKAADTIRNARKPTLAIVSGMAASAGYALVSQADEIEAENESIEVGSIGVVTERVVTTEADKARGVTRYILTSENAPDKRPDVSTDEGRLKIVARLTKLESVFIDYVAAGRNATPDFVKENFGRGGMLIAREALEIGMIDSIVSEINSGIPGTPPPESNASQTGEQTQGEDEMGEITMTEEEFEAKINSAAEKASSKTAASLTEQFEADKKAEAAEQKRKDGFKALLDAYPEQAKMINDEMAKDSAEATADFAIKVGAAETSRLKALEEQEDHSDTGASDTTTQGTGTDKNSGDDFLASMKGA